MNRIETYETRMRQQNKSTPSNHLHMHMYIQTQEITHSHTHINKQLNPMQQISFEKTGEVI